MQIMLGLFKRKSVPGLQNVAYKKCNSNTNNNNKLNIKLCKTCNATLKEECKF